MQSVNFSFLLQLAILKYVDDTKHQTSFVSDVIKTGDLLRCLLA